MSLLSHHSSKTHTSVFAPEGRRLIKPRGRLADGWEDAPCGGRLSLFHPGVFKGCSLHSRPLSSSPWRKNSNSCLCLDRPNSFFSQKPFQVWECRWMPTHWVSRPAAGGRTRRPSPTLLGSGAGGGSPWKMHLPRQPKRGPQPSTGLTCQLAPKHSSRSFFPFSIPRQFFFSFIFFLGFIIFFKLQK